LELGAEFLNPTRDDYQTAIALKRRVG
jgi:hypothetical protein